ncbi:hypothetical protein BOX15_Mlig010787g1 [Macrostomum lignano]|uniref:Uncharacterized protein n=1 Tax=Macrostomum lignano TaxID=282301 RepID=A0A267GTZ8_9PLAT|nr:hypothetical protein BOX15_Mlig010787g1 [Macrostomum lignano]
MSAISDPRWHDQMSAIFGDYHAVMNACKQHKITIDKIYPGVQEAYLRNHQRHQQQQQQQLQRQQIMMKHRPAASQPSPLVSGDLTPTPLSASSSAARTANGKVHARRSLTPVSTSTGSLPPVISALGSTASAAAAVAPAANSSAADTPSGSSVGRQSNCGGSLGWSPALGSEASPFQQQQPPRPLRHQEAEIRRCLQFFRRAHRLVAADAASSPPLRPLPPSPTHGNLGAADSSMSDAESTCTQPCLVSPRQLTVNNVDYAREARQVRLARLTDPDSGASPKPTPQEPQDSVWNDSEDAPLSLRFSNAISAAAAGPAVKRKPRRRRTDSTATSGTVGTDMHLADAADADSDLYLSSPASVDKRPRLSCPPHPPVRHQSGLQLSVPLKYLERQRRQPRPACVEEAATQTEDVPPPLRPTAAVPPVQSSAELAAAAAAAAAAAVAPSTSTAAAASASVAAPAGDSLLQLERLQAARADALEQRWLQESRESLFRRAKSLRQQLDGNEGGAGGPSNGAGDRHRRRCFLESAATYLAGCWVAEDRRQLPASDARRIYRDVAGFVRQHGRAFAERDRRRQPAEDGGEASGVARLTEICVLLLKSLLEYRIYCSYRSDLASLSSAHRSSGLSAERESQLLGQLMPLYHSQELWSHLCRQRDKLRAESASFARLEDEVASRSGVRSLGPNDRLSNNLAYLLAAAEVIAES